MIREVNYNDLVIYEHSAERFNRPSDEGRNFYLTPSVWSYQYKDYLNTYSAVQKDAEFIWFPHQREKLNEEQFGQIKNSILTLRRQTTPGSASGYEQRIAYLETQILLNNYQLYNYQDYLRSCTMILESRRPSRLAIPPVKENNFLKLKTRVLKVMVKKEIFLPLGEIEGSEKIFP